MTDYQIELLVKSLNTYLSAIFPAFIWLIIIPVLLILFFFLGRATALKWLIKHHLRHIKSDEVHELTTERDNAIIERDELLILYNAMKKKFNRLSDIFNSRER